MMELCSYVALFFCLRGEEQEPEAHSNSIVGNDNGFILGNTYAWPLVYIC